MKIKEKILFTSAAIIIFIFLFGKFFLSTLRLRLRDLNQQIDAEEKILKHNLSTRERKDQILKEYTNYQSYLLEPEQDRKIIAEFLKEVEKLAQISGVSIINLTPEGEQEYGEGHQRYNAELKAEAYIEQIIDFLYKIQTSNLLIKMDKFSLSPRDKEANILNLETTISIAIP